MNKHTSTVLISIIIILMIITIGIVLKIGKNVLKTVAGNNTKNNKTVVNTLVANNNDTNTTFENYVYVTNTMPISNTTNVTNEIVYVNEIQSNTISVENIIVQNMIEQNTVNPPPVTNEIKGVYANTGIIPGLHGTIQQAVITNNDIYTSFLTQYNISSTIPGISNYMNEEFFNSHNLGIIYIPLEQGQYFEIEKQGESGGTIFLNLVLNPNYTDNEKTNGMMVLIELEKNTTNLLING